MKILEYFAAGIPVVATSKGAEGIEVISGKEIIIEDALDRLVDAVINLIEHPEQRRQLEIPVESLSNLWIGGRSGNHT